MIDMTIAAINNTDRTESSIYRSLLPPLGAVFCVVIICLHELLNRR